MYELVGLQPRLQLGIFRFQSTDQRFTFPKADAIFRSPQRTESQENPRRNDDRLRRETDHNVSPPALIRACQTWVMARN